MARFIKIIDRDVEGVEREVLYPWDATSQAPITNAFNVQTVYSESVTLTDAQIKALPTTPVEIVAAPGAGYRLSLVSGSVTFDFTGGVYATLSEEANQPRLSVGVLDVSGEVLTGARANSFDELLVDDADVYQSDLSPTGFVIGTLVVNGNAYTPISSLENRPIGVGATNAIESIATNFTGGDAANSMQVRVDYTIIDV